MLLARLLGRWLILLSSVFTFVLGFCPLPFSARDTPEISSQPHPAGEPSIRCSISEEGGFPVQQRDRHPQLEEESEKKQPGTKMTPKNQFTPQKEGAGVFMGWNRHSVLTSLLQARSLKKTRHTLTATRTVKRHPVRRGVGIERTK